MNAATVPILEKETFLPRNISSLYEAAFPKIAHFVKMRGGDLADAKDVFHDGLIIFLPKSEGKAGSTIANVDYLVGICKNIWRRKIRDLNHQRSTLSNFAEDQTDSLAINIDRLVSLLEMSGEKCLNLLRACFFSKGSMQEVAEDLGYSNAHSVSVQKYKCIAKLKLSVLQKKMVIDDFIE